MRRRAFLLALLLSACSYTLTVNLGSLSLNLTDLPPSPPFGGDYVAFPKAPIPSPRLLWT
ncbi:hypothetical protein GCM10007092_06220 [Thermus composti]|uniref:Lipoprotein n=1 Tax=Thermus composti TaxID=532059 RepID=A0ABV6Q1T6_9DEIN|nr:hypothetical protein [Thermus composti]GGM95483.1 hypothetical protein GCM10007092_06220 [Thermus composti]